ncbi:MAG: hypothetical protein WBP93_23735 [Pyrinomonadaceae bacterium]
MRGPRIELHIEELVLHGFERGDRYAVADAIERELSRLLAEQFTEQGIPSSLTQNSESAHLDAGAFHVAPRSKADHIGAQVAQAVHGGLTK